VTAVNPSGSSAGVPFTYNTPVTELDITVEEDGSNRHLEITPETANLGETLNITIPAAVSEATINIGALLNEPVDGSISSAPLPAVNISAGTSLGQVTLKIPSGTTISAPADSNWDGAVQLPTVRANDSATVTPDSGKTATVNSVIEIGFGDIPLTFDKAVRILIPGQAGKEAGYCRGGVFTKISNVMSADSQAAGDALPAGGDGRIDVGQDLVIWTKHFTQFVTYTQTTSGGGGGGGGTSASNPVTTTSGTAMVAPGAGGTISLSGAAKIEIPAGALKGTGSIEVKIQKVTAPPSPPAGLRALGDTYRFSVGEAVGYSFNKPVTLSFSFDAGALAPGEKAEIYHHDQSSGQWVRLGGTASGSTIAAEVDHLSIFAVLTRTLEALEPEPEPAPFAPQGDYLLTDIAGHWAENTIKQLLSLGAITGNPDGAFRPDDAVSRAEFVIILVKAFKVTEPGEAVFSDTGSHWARESIAAAVRAGIVSGYEDNTFKPDQPVSREQMAVLAAKAANLQGEADIGVFTDYGQISAWAAQSVAAVLQAGVMRGYPDGSFLPQAGATRAEAATIIAGLLER